MSYLSYLILIVAGSAVQALPNDAVDDNLLQNGPIRLVQIKILNHSSKNLTFGTYYLDLGINEVPPPQKIKPLAWGQAVFQKASFSVQGTSGVLTYRIGKETGKAGRFAIYWSVPIEYMWNKNWYGIKWIDENETASNELFTATINGSFPFADEVKQASISNQDYVILAKMSDKTKSLLQVKVHHRSDCKRTNDIQVWKC